MKTTRRGFLLTLGAVAHVRAQATEAAPRKVVVGQSLPLTGAADRIGVAFGGGAKLCFDAFNQRHGPRGWSVELRQVDDGYDGKRARDNAARLLDDGADILFGAVGTGSSDAIADVASRRAKILFAPFAASDRLRDAAAGHVFHIRPSLYDEAFKMVRHCATLAQDRIALVADDDAMGRAGAVAVRQALADQKLAPPVAQALLAGSGAAPLEAGLRQVAQAAPQAVILVALYQSSARIIRRLRKDGYGGAFLCFSVVGIDPLFAELGPEIGGIVMTQVVPSPRSSAIPVVREYLAAVENSDQPPSYEGLEGFIAAKALLEAVRRSGKPGDDHALRAALEAMTAYDAGGFRMNLRAGRKEALGNIDLVTITPEGKVLR